MKSSNTPPDLHKLKSQGWQGMNQMLNEQMPVAGASATPWWKGKLFLSGAGITLLALGFLAGRISSDSPSDVSEGITASTVTSTTKSLDNIEKKQDHYNKSIAFEESSTKLSNVELIVTSSTSPSSPAEMAASLAAPNGSVSETEVVSNQSIQPVDFRENNSNTGNTSAPASTITDAAPATHITQLNTKPSVSPSEQAFEIDERYSESSSLQRAVAPALALQSSESSKEDATHRPDPGLETKHVPTDTSLLAQSPKASNSPKKPHDKPSSVSRTGTDGTTTTENTTEDLSTSVVEATVPFDSPNESTPKWKPFEDITPKSALEDFQQKGYELGFNLGLSAVRGYTPHFAPDVRLSKRIIQPLSIGVSVGNMRITSREYGYFTTSSNRSSGVSGINDIRTNDRRYDDIAVRINSLSVEQFGVHASLHLTSFLDLELGMFYSRLQKIHYNSVHSYRDSTFQYKNNVLVSAIQTNEGQYEKTRTEIGNNLNKYNFEKFASYEIGIKVKLNKYMDLGGRMGFAQNNPIHNNMSAALFGYENETQTGTAATSLNYIKAGVIFHL